jgi:hypothetical protein
MSGVLGLTSGLDWFINGWGWGILMGRAIEDSEDEAEVAEFTSGLHSNGLILDQLDTPLRSRIVSTLVRSTGVLIEQYSVSGVGSDRQFAERLRELAEWLAQEGQTT